MKNTINLNKELKAVNFRIELNRAAKMLAMMGRKTGSPYFSGEFGKERDSLALWQSSKNPNQFYGAFGKEKGEDGYYRFKFNLKRKGHEYEGVLVTDRAEYFVIGHELEDGSVTCVAFQYMDPDALDVLFRAREEEITMLLDEGCQLEDFSILDQICWKRYHTGVTEQFEEPTAIIR